MTLANPTRSPLTPSSTEIIELKLGDRTYEFVSFLNFGETGIFGDEMVRRAGHLRANSGESDARWILDSQTEIPVELRPLIVLNFPAWRKPGNPREIGMIHFDRPRWVHCWRHLDWRWIYSDRLVRPK